MTIAGDEKPRCSRSPTAVYATPESLHYAVIQLLVGVDAVEQELERPVRLRAERDLGAEQVQLALPDLRLGDRDALVEVGLAPCPTAAQRVRRVVPGNRPHTLRGGVGAKGKDRALVEEHIDLLRKASRHRERVVDLHL